MREEVYRLILRATEQAPLLRFGYDYRGVEAFGSPYQLSVSQLGRRCGAVLHQCPSAACHNCCGKEESHVFSDPAQSVAIGEPFREVSSGDATTALDDNDKIQSPPLLRWEPDLADIHGSTDRTSDMDDDWMVRGGKTRYVASGTLQRRPRSPDGLIMAVASVTPLKANSMHAVQAEGEIELDA
ncbi:unnamed protein product [Aspergillus niger]|nr:unnamed protein product [Aspergillus niger]